MHDHLPQLALVLLVYAALALSCLGWGSAAARVLRLTASDAVTRVWLGWAVVLLLFQALHFVLPLNAFATGPVWLIGIVLSIPRVARALRDNRRGMMRVAALVFAVVVAAAWIASRSMLSPAVYDAGLYHLNAIRWINVFPIVPGLGNLHGRLAFNQAFFTYAASLNVGPLLANGSRIANGFLLLLAAATFLARLRPVEVRRNPERSRGVNGATALNVSKPGYPCGPTSCAYLPMAPPVAARLTLLWHSHPFEHLPALFALPILGHLALHSPGLASPTPDLASELLQLVMFVIFAGVARRWLAGEEAALDETAVLTVLAATAITIKLSNLAFAVVVMAVSLGLARRMRGVLRVSVLAMVILIVWIARGYVSSGAPLYPSTIGYVAFDWAVPRDDVAHEARQIRGWAREPSQDWSTALDNWNWLSGWSERVWRERVTVIAPALLGISFLAAVGVVAARKKPRRLKESIILLPVIAGLAYWFFTAPDPRFAHALFFCFAIAAALLFLAFVQPWATHRTFALLLCAVFATTHLGLALKTIRRWEAITQISIAGWQPLPRVPLIQRTTTSGLVILVPAAGERCWDSPLPCAPYFRDDLRARVPGRLESGFAVTHAK